MEPPEFINILVINGMCPISRLPLAIMSIQKQRARDFHAILYI